MNNNVKYRESNIIIFHNLIVLIFYIVEIIGDNEDSDNFVEITLN